MFKSKLVSSLRTLSNKELKWFEAYIASPFFNKNAKVIQLLDILQKYHPQYEEHKVAMEAIFPKLFQGEKKVDEQKLRYVMTDLTKLLEDYLAYLEYNKNEIYRNHLLLSAYDQRGLDKYFQATLEETQSIQKKQPYRDVNYYFNEHLIGYDTYVHAFSLNERGTNTHLQGAVDNLDLYYLSNRMRYSCTLLEREDLLQEKYNNLFLDEILTFLGKTNLENIPSVSIYHAITMTFLEPDNISHYRKLISLLDDYSSAFPKDEVKNMYTHSLSYCNRRVIAGDISFQEEMLNLYKTMVKKEIILNEEGYFPHNSFKNIVTLALRLGQVDYIENFINEYKDLVTPEFRESSFVYNMANLHYFRKEFGKALRLLQNVEMKDIFYLLDGKVLLLKTYYELNEDEPYFSLVDAFTNYLKRNKLISDNQRMAYLNFIRYAKKLMQLRLGSRFSMTELREEMQGLSKIYNLQWLLGKIDELAEKKEGQK